MILNYASSSHRTSFAPLSGSDAILLGAETLRGLYPVETISTVGRICAEVQFLSYVFFFFLLIICIHSLKNSSTFLYHMQAEKVYNQDLYFKKAVKFVGEPMSHLESIASSAV